MDINTHEYTEFLLTIFYIGSLDRKSKIGIQGGEDVRRMPYLYRSISAKEPYNSWLFGGKRPAT